MLGYAAILLIASAGRDFILTDRSEAAWAFTRRSAATTVELGVRATASEDHRSQPHFSEPS